MNRLLLFIFLLFNLLLQAQSPRETRAVWVSTNFKLDWPPPTFNQAAQKKELKKIFDNIERKNLNTIYFQVRSNGTVLFRSEMELFSPYITGNIGDFGNYDPLEFAIEEAHKRGLEIHAWINTMRVFTGNNISIKNNPIHISQYHPDWVYEKSDNSIWLNPGIPEVRDYLIELISEIIRNYNVDGIQLDFIRYPKVPIYDSESYNKYGGGIPIAQWRRDNITKFITSLNQTIKGKNPKVKLGVTPIGIYKSIKDGRGMEGYSDVFQDTREWLRLGIIDYAVPQIYWDAKTSPKFDLLAKDWITNSYGKQIIIGIGAYKPEVYSELEREINITRKLNTSGMAFFRYKNIEHKTFYSFAEKTLPVEMPWIEEIPRLAELELTSNFQNNKAILNFNINSRNLSDNGYFALYERDGSMKNSKSKLIKVVPNNISKMSFALQTPSKINHFYSATQFDQLWNESSKENSITKLSIPKLKKLENGIEPVASPVLLQRSKSSTLLVSSRIEEEIILLSGDLILERFLLFEGINEVNLSYDLTEYENIKVKFTETMRTVELR